MCFVRKNYMKKESAYRLLAVNPYSVSLNGFLIKTGFSNYLLTHACYAIHPYDDVEQTSISNTFISTWWPVVYRNVSTSTCNINLGVVNQPIMR